MKITVAVLIPHDPALDRPATAERPPERLMMNIEFTGGDVNDAIDLAKWVQGTWDETKCWNKSVLGIVFGKVIPATEWELIPLIMAYRSGPDPDAEIRSVPFRLGLCNGGQLIDGGHYCVVDSTMFCQKGPPEALVKSGQAENWKLGDDYEIYPWCPMLVNSNVEWNDMWIETGPRA